MSNIIGLPKKVYKDAVLLGESMQIINCMRDIVEDYQMGRIYIPVEDLEKFGLSVDNFLNKKNRNKLKDVINFQLQRGLLNLEKKPLCHFLILTKEIFLL